MEKLDGQVKSMVSQFEWLGLDLVAVGIDHLGVSGGNSVNTGVKIEGGLGVQLPLEERPQGFQKDWSQESN